MAEKTLKDRIKQVSFWFVSSILGYLVVAFFLKSKYPMSEYVFEPAIAYDVVKDALTLAATFLAPVAAFVLFSDWREQFSAEIKHRCSSRMFDLQFKLLRKLYHAKNLALAGKYHRKENKDNAEEYFILRKEFENNIEEIKRACGESEFTHKSKQALNEFISLHESIDGLCSLKKSLEKDTSGSTQEVISNMKDDIKKISEDIKVRFKQLESDLRDIDSWTFDHI